MITVRRTIAALSGILLVVSFLPSRLQAAGPVPDFSFVQISDNHINPHPAGAPDPGPDARSVPTLEWVVDQMDKPQPLAPLGLTAPKPAFLISTGDLTEYGVINKTFDDFLSCFEGLEIPLYVTPGNHDNTWTSMSAIMRKRYGGDHYSFDRFNCHFISFNSAGLQEPVPCIDQRTLTWLERDLAKVNRDTPVFMFCHHPLSSGEFAKPYEQLRLFDVIGDYNVVLLMMGHGHGIRHERWDTLDSVMGGETFRKNDGYNIIAVIDNVLHVVYCFKDSARGMKAVLSKPIQREPRPTLTIEPNASRVSQGDSIGFQAVVAYPPDTLAIARRPIVLTASLDGGETVTLRQRSARRVETTPTRTFAGLFPTAGLLPGKHFIRVTATIGDLSVDRAIELAVEPEKGSLDVAESRLPAGMKASPVAWGKDMIVATTGGGIERVSLNGRALASTRIADLGVEILHAPALRSDTLYVSAAEKGVVAIGPDGKEKWSCDVGAPVYGTPALDAEHVYVGDLEGLVHAIDRTSGKLTWSRRHATYSIEMPLLLHEGVLYFGAWDGFVYAVKAKDGSLAWKDHGPAGHRKESRYKSRYYGPADCAPVIVGRKLIVADRAYCLGAYDLDGGWIGEIADGVSGVGPTSDGDGFYTRGLESGLVRYDEDCEVVWASDVPLGRFPIPPTAAGDRVYVCSNTGTLTVHDAATGEVRYACRATPGLHVMAPVAVDAEGGAYVVGMDGSITRVVAR